MRPETPIETSKEKPPVRVETITKEELENIVYGDSAFPQDKRFFNVEEGGVFKYFDINQMLNVEMVFPVVRERELVVGIARLQKSPYKEDVKENRWWVSFICVDPKYEGRGYASKLVEEIFRYAKEQGMAIENSSYRPEGREKLKHVFEREAATNPDVNFRESTWGDIWK